MKYRTDLILGEAFCLFIFFYVLDWGLSVLNGLQFYFWLCDSENRELFSCANKNFLFWRLSNPDYQIVRPALVSGPPIRKKPYNKHLISLVFSVRTVNYGSSFFFFHRFMARALRAWAINRWKKNSVRNFQYGPKTQLIRGIYYMAESVFAMRLVNLRSVTCYTDQNLTKNAHFGALNLFTSEKKV